MVITGAGAAEDLKFGLVIVIRNVSGSYIFFFIIVLSEGGIEVVIRERREVGSEEKSLIWYRG